MMCEVIEAVAVPDGPWSGLAALVVGIRRTILVPHGIVTSLTNHITRIPSDAQRVRGMATHILAGYRRQNMAFKSMPGCYIILKTDERVVTTKSRGIARWHSPQSRVVTVRNWPFSASAIC
jgi:hypothetical protein